MVKLDAPLRVAVCAVLLGLAATFTPTPGRAQDLDLPAAAESPPVDDSVGRLVDWALSSGDNGGLPFVVIDKRSAVVFVYAADGRPLGAEPALLGSAHGDDSAPGIGERPLSAILPEERTTPAGRFVGAYGPALGQFSTIFWVDYNTAVSLHPVITANPAEHRLERLASQTPDDNFITYGCINVAPEFYQDVIHATFEDTPGVVYVLPDTKPLEEVFPGLAAGPAGGEPRAALTAAAF